MIGEEELTLTDAFYESADERLRQRLGKSRYLHSKSVSNTAVDLACVYDVDERKARIAGLLHDWDKCYSDDEIRERARELEVEVSDEVRESMPQLLHGMTAARVLRREYPGLGDDVLQAISRHTTAATDMTPLDMVVFIADVIEPLREYGDMDGLRASVGAVALDKLFLMTFGHVLISLVKKGRRVHPNSIKVWNQYATTVKEGDRYHDEQHDGHRDGHRNGHRLAEDEK